MKRTIKFRVWDGKAMRQPSTEVMDWDDDGTMVTGESLVFLQFTGLKDKNGEDLYEGDVIETVSEMPLGPMSMTEVVETIHDACMGLDQEDFKIMGIYENPELLKAAEN